MQKIAQLFLLCITLFLTQFALAASNSPIGYWRTIDDVTGKPKAIVRISESSGRLYGTIVKIFPRPGYDQNEVCSACTGSNHNKRIVGLTILQGLKANPKDQTEWSGGSILDPLNGKTYKCYVQVINGGNQLTVRGYIGVSLFGRTQTWSRVSGS